jgi:hypothetical protein
MNLTPRKDDVERLKYRKNCPKDRAVVAADSTGKLIAVLEHIGPGLEYLRGVEPLADAFLRDDPPPSEGIWMWEGIYKTYVPYEGESDSYLEGSYRKLTDEEAKRSMSGDSPWDPALWFEMIHQEEAPPILDVIEPNSSPYGSEIELVAMDQIPLDASAKLLKDQIAARHYWIYHRFVGNLYKSITWSEMELLEERLRTIRDSRKA